MEDKCVFCGLVGESAEEKMSLAQSEVERS